MEITRSSCTFLPPLLPTPYHALYTYLPSLLSHHPLLSPVFFLSAAPRLLLHSPPSPGARSAASIILRGANDFMVDEMERSLHDSLSVVKRVLESNLVVPGGGAVETALSIYLENFATSIVRSIQPITCMCML